MAPISSNPCIHIPLLCDLPRPQQEEKPVSPSPLNLSWLMTYFDQCSEMFVSSKAKPQKKLYGFLPPLPLATLCTNRIYYFLYFMRSSHL